MSEKMTGKMKKAMFDIGFEIVSDNNPLIRMTDTRTCTLEWVSGNYDTFHKARLGLLKFIFEGFKKKYYEYESHWHGLDSLFERDNYLDVRITHMVKLEDLSDE